MMMYDDYPYVTVNGMTRQVKPDRTPFLGMSTEVEVLG
jgi:hypothetical protein